MPVIQVRDVPENVHRRLKERAAREAYDAVYPHRAARGHPAHERLPTRERPGQPRGQTEQDDREDQPRDRDTGAARGAPQYLRTWIESDPGRRRAAIEEVRAVDGKMSVSSLGVILEGVDAIVAHIERAHEDMIAGTGLRFV